MITSLAWITYLLLFIAGSSKAASDLYSEGVLKPSKSESWKNKWKLDDKGKIIPNDKKPWYYLWLWKPMYIERFPYSSEFLVFLTDPWHRFNTIKMTSIIIGILFFHIELHPVIEFLLLYGVFAAGFTTVYRIFKH